MGSNLYKVERDLRSIAKRYKSIKYSVGLAILFLMLGVSAFSEEVESSQVNGVPTREEIASSRESLNNLPVEQMLMLLLPKYAQVGNLMLLYGQLLFSHYEQQIILYLIKSLTKLNNFLTSCITTSLKIC